LYLNADYKPLTTTLSLFNCESRHVAQDIFSGVKIASIFTIRPEKDPKRAYNSLILRLYGLIFDAGKMGAVQSTVFVSFTRHR
jgi:hypothetical protein